MKKISVLLMIAWVSVGSFAVEVQESTGDNQPVSFDQVYENTKTFIAANGVQFLMNVLAAAAVFFIGRWLARVIANLVQKAATKAHLDLTLCNFVKNIIYTALLIFVIIAALGQLGVKTGSFIAVIGAAGLAVGLALQGSLSNFAAGVLLILFKPFKAGDYIEAAGTAGSVQEIEIFTTTLNTPDNCKIIIPNAQITSGNIKNFSANDIRRVDLVIGVSYGDDLKQARQVIEGVLKADSRVLAVPAYTVAVSELADSSVNFVVRPWVNKADYWGVYFDLTENIKVALEENNLTIPFPQHDVHLIKADTVS